MERFQPETYLKISRVLTSLVSLTHKYKEKPVTNKVKNTIKPKFMKIVDDLDKIRLNQSVILGKRILNALSPNKSIQSSTLERSFLELQHRINDEISSQFFTYIPQERAKYYDPDEPIFGRLVQQRFTSQGIVFDIEESGKCFAVARYTACVFHLMRILEGGMAALSKGLKIPDPIKAANRNWGNTLSKIKDAIDAKNSNPDPTWPDVKDFFERCHAMLNSVRNVWRNQTMHVGEKYTQEEAEDIFNAVKGFMRQLATKLNESGVLIP